MACDVCGAEAVGRCFNCGGLFCAQHGVTNCMRCENSFRAGDPRQDRITTSRRRSAQPSQWWRPQPAEEYKPPACYQCQGIARLVCGNCQQRFCPDHAGKNGNCAECNKSSYLGLAILGAVGLAIAIVLLMG